MGTQQRNRLEAFVLDENRTAILFYLAGAGAGLGLLPDGHLAARDRNIIMILVGCLLLGSIARVIFRRHITTLAAQILFSAGWLLVSVAAAIGPNVHANLAVLYIWVAVYAALYFTPRAIVIQVGAAQIAYLVVLTNSRFDLRDVIVSWVTIFVTASVLAAVVYALVSTLRRNSHEDHLTGLPNRLSWDERFEAELERAKRSGAAISVVSIDIDNFKSVNDEYGHAAGDRLLRDVSDRWREVVRGGADVVARLGGDEFGLLAPGSDAREITEVLERLQYNLPADLSCSMGAATWDRIESSSELFRRADQVMFQAKRERRGT